MNNIPKPASPLPWGYVERHVLASDGDYVAANNRGGNRRDWIEDGNDNMRYIAWAANNARALYELLSRVCKYLDDESGIEADSPVHADIAAALKAARGEA